MAEEEMSLSVDLVDETKKYLAFLQEMVQQPCMVDHAFLTQALRRYRFLWLPLAAAREREDIEPPGDIHWIWYLHMLRPLAYFQDCTDVIGKVPCHKFHIFTETRDSAQERTRLLWQRRYSSHSFDAGLSEKNPLQNPENQTKSFRSKSVDIEKTVEVFFNHILIDVASHKTFAYQAMLPHYTDEKFIKQAVERYKVYLQQRSKAPSFQIVPSQVGIDVELVHRAHMLRPLKYRHDLEKLFQGQFPNLSIRGPSTPPPGDGTAADFKEIPKIPGAMFRGDPFWALRKFVVLTSSDIYKMSHKGCNIGLRKLRVENVNYRSVSVIVGVAKWSTLEMMSSQLQSQGNPPYEWQARQNEDLVNLEWKTEGYEQFYVSVYRKTYHNSKHSKALIGCLFDKQLFDIVENAQKLKQPLRPTFSKTASVKSLDVRFMMTAEISNVRRLSIELSMKRNDFEQRLLPENIREIWGAFMMERLAPGVSNVCTFALHRMCNHKEEETFTVRVIHSLSLRMSVIQVMYTDKIAAVSHLIGSESLPTSDQVESDSCYCLDPHLGERAMLLKNSKGDWAIAKACWKPSSDYKRFKPSDCGLIALTIYSLESKEIETHELPVEWLVYEKESSLKIFGTELDLLTGRVKILRDNENVAETVCLCYTLSTLITLCLPSVYSIRKSNRFFCTCTNEEDNLRDHEMLLAVGYGLEIPSNDWLLIQPNAGSVTMSTTPSNADIQTNTDSTVVYSWYQAGGPESRESSFEVDRVSSGGYVNRSFDSGSETKF